MNGRGCRIRWILVALLASLPLGAHAERLPIKTHTTADGLAHNEINKIVRDSRGFLWFATSDGLSRFDGYGFSNYSVGQGLPHPTVKDFLETKSGELVSGRMVAPKEMIGTVDFGDCAQMSWRASPPPSGQ